MERNLFSRHYHRILLMIGLVLLAGCAATPWVWQHPKGLGQQELQEATSECERLAQEEVSQKDYFYPSPYPFFPSHPGRFYSHRHVYPYFYPSSFSYDAQRQFYDQDRFFDLCMRAKGWKKVLIAKPR